MTSHSSILVLIIFAITVDVAYAQVTLESFQLCIVDAGLSPDVIVHHSTGNSSLYAELDHRWNIRPVHAHPLAYFVPRITTDVQIAVRCARANNIPVVPKSGGHSAELLSYGKTGTIVISFQYMKKIEVNATEKTAVIESGAVLSEIYQKLLNEGGFALASGLCDDVGIGGIALGGGDGASTPMYNLTVDNILEMEMVDSNGELHLVNENVNSDLFWALRGVGSGFIGIVTSFKFKLFNATDLRSSRLTLNYDLDNIGPVLLAYQDFLVWAEKEELNVLTILVVYANTGQLLVEFSLLEEVSSGQPTNLEMYLNKVNEIFPPLEGRNVTMTFPSYTAMRRDMANIEFISVNANPAQYIKKKSFFVNRAFTADELKNVVQTFRRARNLNVRVIIYGYVGAYNRIPATAMSYVHRGHLYLVSPRVVADAQVSDEEAQLAHDWLNEFVSESKLMDNGESYQNYVDLDLSDNFMERYYGVNSQRLTEIKRKWDPDNYFQNGQSILIGNIASKDLTILSTSFLCLCLLNVIKNYFNFI